MSDHESLAGHENYVLFLLHVIRAIGGFGAEKDLARLRFGEPLWLLYLSKPLAHSRCSRMSAVLITVFSLIIGLELTEGRDLNRVTSYPQSPIQSECYDVCINK